MKTNRQVKPMNELPFDLNHNFVSKRNSSAMKQTIKKFSSTFAHHRKWQRLERLPKTNSSTSSSPKIQVDIVCRLLLEKKKLISTNVSSTLNQISFFAILLPDGQACIIFTVIIHPNFHQRAHTSGTFMNFLLTLIYEGLENKYPQFKLDTGKVLFGSFRFFLLQTTHAHE